MIRLTRNGYLGLAGAAVLMLTGCATMRINSNLERGVDLRQYRTFALAPADSFSTGDPRLDNNRFFIERMQAAIERQLAPKGIGSGRSERPTLSSTTTRVWSSGSRSTTSTATPAVVKPRSAGPSCTTRARCLSTLSMRARAGSYDGWAEGSLHGVIDNQDWMNAKVDDAVARIWPDSHRHRSPSDDSLNGDGAVRCRSVRHGRFGSDCAPRRAVGGVAGADRP